MADERSEERLQRLEKSQQQLWTLIDNVKDYAIYTLDTEGNITSWSRSSEAMKGYTESEVLGKHFSLFFTPEDIARNDPQRSLMHAAREGRHEEDGWRLRKDGTLFWANVVVTALRDPTGRLTGFGKVTRDLTRRKWGEEERFAKIFRSSPTCLAITTLNDGRLVDVNEGFERLTGYTRQESLGRTVVELNLWPGSQDRAQMVKALQTRGSLRDREGSVRDKQGNVHSVIASFEMLELGGQETILTAVRDISERKRIEEELVRANQKLTARV